MNQFFEKLNQQAERWINAMDTQLQEPLVRTMTGAALIDGTTASAAHHEETPVTPPARPAAQPRSEQIAPPFGAKLSSNEC